MVGRQLSHYKVLKKIGQGGMGEVYLAEDVNLRRTAALKILPVEVASDQKRMHRFINEARTASSLKHPNVVPIYEIGQSEDIRFIAMEYIEGRTLESRIHGRPLPNDEIINIAIQIVDALDEAHSKGIIHRDIKSSNIMITNRGQVKILDFGLSKIMNFHSEDISVEETKTQTEPGTVLGTILYMSPEQALGKKVDYRSDLFSLGIVLYQMATGTLPFSGMTPSDTINRIVNARPEAPARFNYNLPPDVERMIRKCLEKDPDCRYQTARELLVDLKNFKRDTESVSRDSMALSAPAKRRRFFPFVAAVLILLAVAGAYALFRKYVRPPAIESIAVLPFLNATADPKTEYLSDGITESTINSLSQLPGIKVMASSTVFRFKGRQTDPVQFGRDLKVDAVLTGAMNQRDQQLLIHTELINVADGTQIWGSQYNRSLSDVLVLQKEIAAEIVQQLHVKLSGEQRKRLDRNYPANVEAYQLYLKGRYQWNKRSPEGYRKAIDLFRDAIEKDPTYALAYAGLADCYSTDNSPFPQEEGLIEARAASLKALEMDPDLAEAHTSLAAVKTAEWDWSGAEQEFKRAIELNPNYPTAHQWYSELLAFTGRFEQAFAEIKMALELDPLSLVINTTYGWIHFYSEEYEKALVESRKVLEMDPDFWPARILTIVALIELKRYDESFAMMERGFLFREETVKAAREAVRVHGEKAMLQIILKEAIHSFAEGQELPYNIAVLYTKLGDRKNAVEWLEKAYHQRDSVLLPWIAVDPSLKPLRNEARFQEIVRKMGLPENRFVQNAK